MAESESSKPRSRFPLYFAAGWTLLLAVLYFPTLVGIFWWDGPFEGIESYWIDRLFVFHHDRMKAGDPRIVLAAIDDDTVKEYQWPFTRDVHARLIDRLVALRAKTIVFDVMFLDPDKRNPDGDRLLVEATRRSGRTVHVGLSTTQEVPGQAPIYVARWPIDGLAEASAYLGHPNVDEVIDADGHIRRMQLFSEHVDYPLDRELRWPTLDGAAVASFEGQPLRHYLEIHRPPWRLEYVNFRRIRNWPQHPARRSVDARLLLDEISSAYQPVSVADILSGRLTEQERQALRGALVLVGSRITGLYDHYPSPFNKHTPGVEFHANFIDNTLHGDYLRRVSRGRTLLLIAAFAWLPLLLLNLPPALGFGVTGALLAGWVAFTNWQFLREVRYDFIAPTVSLLGSFLVMTVQRVLKEGAEKKRIQQTFGQFVSPDVVKDLVQNPDKARIGAQKRDMTVFFLDIAHFTTISEKMEAAALMQFLNKYLTALTEVIHEQTGTVDKYIGDCIMAFWNAPLEQKDHQARACLAAIRCQEIIADLNKNLDPGLPEMPAIRIGVNSGVMNVGFTGSQQKLQYTVIGDEVNLGSRLEGANKFFGSHIMASESCYEGARDAVEARILGQVRVVGKSIPIKVYELLARKGGLSPAWAKALPLYNEGVDAYLKRDFEAARAAFGKFLQILPDDKPAKLYFNACEDYVAIPPPSDWDGVFNLTAK